MLTARVRTLLLLGIAGHLGLAFVACAPAAKPRAHVTADASDYNTDDPGDPSLPDARPPDYNNPDSDAFGAGERGRDASAPLPEGGGRPNIADAGPPPPPPDDGGPPPPVDAGPVYCPTLGAGDLAIVEFMISSQSGSGDRGEWVEIQSTKTDCILNLKGLHVESPRGASAPDAVDVTDDLFLPPNGTFIVADTTITDLNHDLPGIVLSWIATDALKNDGDTITVSAGGTTIDTITYGSWTAHVGRSVSFPVDCAWSVRTDWARWSWSFHQWQAAPAVDGGVPMLGTPNGDNSDVACY